MDAASIGIASTTVVGLAGIGAEFFEKASDEQGDDFVVQQIRQALQQTAAIGTRRASGLGAGLPPTAQPR